MSGSLNWCWVFNGWVCAARGSRGAPLSRALVLAPLVPRPGSLPWLGLQADCSSSPTQAVPKRLQALGSLGQAWAGQTRACKSWFYTLHDLHMQVIAHSIGAFVSSILSCMDLKSVLPRLPNALLLGDEGMKTKKTSELLFFSPSGKVFYI